MQQFLQSLSPSQSGQNEGQNELRRGFLGRFIGIFTIALQANNFEPIKIIAPPNKFFDARASISELELRESAWSIISFWITYKQSCKAKKYGRLVEEWMISLFGNFDVPFDENK